MAWRGVARLGKAGKAGPGRARHGVARRGEAGKAEIGITGRRMERKRNAGINRVVVVANRDHQHSDGAWHSGEFSGDEMKTIKSAWLDMKFAPRDGRKIIVYDPKPSVELGPDIHEAYFDTDHDRFVACKGVPTDPFDIQPEAWFCSDGEAIEKALMETK